MKVFETVFSVLAVFAVVAIAAPASAQTQWFSARIAGSNIMDDSGDADAWGVGVLGVGDGEIAYYIWVTDLAQPTAAHIHAGSAGENGGIVIDFEASFNDAGGNSWVASGSAAADTGTIAGLLERPSAFYFNVHNADHPAGAARGQILGGGSTAFALAGTLNGNREVDNPGDPDGEGFASVVFDDGMAHFYFNVMNTEEPTAAHIHRGLANENGSIVVDSDPVFNNGVAISSVVVDDDLAREILAAPDAFYFNVHDSAFPTGAVRGQLRSTETVRIFPVISRADGAVGSRWRTNVDLANLTDAGITTWAEWFPANESGLGAAADTTVISIGAGATERVEDAVAALFGADGNGALIVSSTEPIAAVAHIFNDQRANPAVGGTFGQFAPSTGPSDLPTSGILLLGSNRPASSGTGFRSNLVLFNPHPFAVDLTLTAKTLDGGMLGTDTMTLQPWANVVKGVFTLISSVPAAQRTQDALTVSFTATAPVASAISPVDNVTSDGIYVVPAPAQVMATVGSGANRAPNGTIVAPLGSQTIQEGQSVSFEGSAEDPDGDAMTYLWNFGDSISSTALVPGNHTYSNSGTYTVTFTVTDSHGTADPTPDFRTVTVTGGGEVATFTAVQQQIFTPSCAFSGCHGGASPAQGMNLSAGSAYSNIVNVPSTEFSSLDRIEPSHPDSSYLYLKVTGDGSITGSRMPRGGAMLSQDLLDLLRDWIERGAPND